MGEDGGAATVLAAFLVIVLATVVVACAWVGCALLARHRAQAAADLAALAAATRLPEGAAAACQQAQSLARAMRAGVRSCQVAGLDVTVTVVVDTGLRLGGPASATARAGPVG